MHHIFNAHLVRSFYLEVIGYRKADEKLINSSLDNWHFSAVFSPKQAALAEDIARENDFHITIEPAPITANQKAMELSSSRDVVVYIVKGTVTDVEQFLYRLIDN